MIDNLLSRVRGWVFKVKLNLGFLFHRRKIALSTIIRIAGNAQVIVGSHSRISEICKIVVHPGGSLIIGENTSVDRLCEIIVEKDSNLKIGNNVFIGSTTNIRVTGEMVIGNDCRIAQLVSIINGNYQFKNKNSLIRNQSYQNGFVYIGDDVWIGAASVILPNVKIKKGAVIGAASVISKDVDEYAVVVGNPQKMIKTRG